jgi:ribosome-associated protein
MGYREGLSGAEMTGWKAPVPEEDREQVEEPNPAMPESAYEIETMRSSGKGGQNVNKVESKVRLTLNLSKLATFSERQKQLLREEAGGRWLEEGDAIAIVSQETRDQPQNRRIAKEKLAVLIAKALKPKLERKPTKPSHRQKAIRLADKRHQSGKKTDRGSKGQDGW